jgi:hypothetical protein
MSPFAKFISISRDGEEIAKNFKQHLLGKSTIDTKRAYSWVKDQTWDKMADLYLKLWSV